MPLVWDKIVVPAGTPTPSSVSPIIISPVTEVVASAVPERVQNPRLKTLGISVPDHPITLSLLETLGEPLMIVTLTMAGETLPLTDPQEIRERLGDQLKVIIAGGYCGPRPSTVIDLSG